MKKILLVLSGFVLLGLLSYIGYIDKSQTIKNDLISKIDNAYKDRNITGIKVSVKGQGLKITRVLLLKGSVLTEENRIEAGDIANNIQGIKYIDNQITIIEEKKIAPKKEVRIEKDINIEKEVIVKKEVAIKKEIIIEKASIDKEIIVEPKIIVEKKPIVNISTEKENIETIIPVVVEPIAIPKTVEVPIPVKAVTAPVAIQVEEKKEEIPSNSKGVE